jgi:hypothetical protein
MNAANVDLGNLMLRLNAQAMEIIRLRQMVEERDALNVAHISLHCAQAERLANLVAGKRDEGVRTDYCEACSTSFVRGHEMANNRPVVWFLEAVAIPWLPPAAQCHSACASCVAKHGLEGRALAW